MWTSDAAILVTIQTYPTGARELHGMAAAGRIGSIVDVLIPQAEQWGRAMGCLFAAIESRLGWARMLKAGGYHPYQTIIRKEL